MRHDGNVTVVAVFTSAVLVTCFLRAGQQHPFALRCGVRRARKEKLAMAGRTITITLPEGLYERVQATARASACSVEEVCARLIALSLPELENELPPSLREEFARLPLLRDGELAAVAHGMMNDEQQAELEVLATRQRQRTLTASEAARFMLRKAEAYRVLARRGQRVFATVGEGGT